MCRHLDIALIILTGILASCSAETQAPPPKPVDTSLQESPKPDATQPVTSGNTPTAADIAATAALGAQFDPGRNPAADLETAKVEAKRGGKHIILEVGGQWCQLCRDLDQFIGADAQTRSFRDANYIWLKVNYSDDNPNHAFLNQWPTLQGFPHFFVLDADGKRLHSQAVADLLKDHVFNRQNFTDFLNTWAPGHGAPSTAP